MLTGILNDFSAAKIRYCILHGWQSLPESLPSDLDMVVGSADLEAVERILRNSDGGQLVQLLQHESSCFYFVLAVRAENQLRFVLVDVATDYRRNGRVFFTAEDLLAGRRQWRTFWVASPRMEYEYLLVKKVLKGEMPQHQKARLRHLSERLGKEAGSSAYYLFGKKYGDFIISYIRSANWNAFESNLSRLKKALARQVVLRDPFNPLRYLIAETKRFWNRCRFPTGLFVAVLGPDGSGKTTLINSLGKDLTGAFRRTEMFHLRPGTTGANANHAPVTNPHGKASYPWWLSVLKIPYYSLDYALGYLCKVRPRLVRSTLVLFDRYYDDLLVDPRRYRYGGPMTFARLARTFLPKPDLYLILDMNEKALLARKQEVSPEELSRQREAYRKLAIELPNAVLLDSSLCPKEVALNAGEAILEYLRRRYLTRRHLWFRDNGSETLHWLESVLFSSKQSCFAVSKRGVDDHELEWETAGSFGWLTLNNGRGYLIPLGSRQAALTGLRLYNEQKLKAKIAKKVLAASLNGRSGCFLLPKIRMLVRRDLPKEEKTKVSLLEHLREIVGRREISFAVSLGTPGPHRKPVLEMIDPKDGVVGFVKVGWNGATNALVRNEADVSRYLSTVSLNSFSVPTLLYAGWWHDHFLCIQSAPRGTIRSAPKNLDSQYLSVLDELRSFHIRWMPLQDSVFWRKLLQRIEAMGNTIHHGILQRGLYTVERLLCNNPLPFHLSHGDFAPWNAQLSNDRLFVFDWEYADFESPPLWDLLHFNVQTLRLIENRSPGEIHQIVIHGNGRGEPKRSHVNSISLSDDALKPLFLLYLLDRLSFYATDNKANVEQVRFFALQAQLFF